MVSANVKAWTWRLGALDSGKPRQPWVSQREAFAKLAPRRQGAGWIDMGMGKTRLAINIAEYHRIHDGSCHTVILAPKDLAEDPWLEQVQDCLTMDAKGRKIKNPPAIINIGASDNRVVRLAALQKAKEERIHYIFLHYEGLVSLLDEVLEFFGFLKEPFMCIADESTAIKHWHTARSKAAKKLGDMASWRLALSGSPTPQGPQDAFGQYLWLDETIFGARFVAFRYEYMLTNNFNGIIGLKPDMHKEFYDRFHSAAVVQKKKDYSDIPPKVYETVHYDLEKDEKEAYKKFAQSWLLEFGRKDRVNRVVEANNALVSSLRLAQICTGFSGGKTVKGQDNVDISFKSKTKLRALQALVERLDGKFVVWCRWRKNVRDVLQLLDKMGVVAVSYYGDMEQEDLEKAEDAFKGDPRVRAMVATPHKGARGKNWQGPEVKTAIYFSQDYTAEFRQQSEDRIHRGEITHSVTIFDMVARGTIEKRIVEGLKKKDNFQTQLMTDPKAFLGAV